MKGFVMKTETLTDSLAQGMAEVVPAIYENMLGLPLTHNAACSAAECSCELCASVLLSGSWKGWVVLQCGREQAHCFAQRFLSLPAGEVTDQIAVDVLGELANMIAGNLKPLLASGIRISVATISKNGCEDTMGFHPSVHREIRFRCQDGCFVVKVLAAPAL